MKDAIRLTHEFVEYIPKSLSEGTIYISIKFATAAHKCVCGCGNEVVTPLSPTDWKLIYDGESVSIDPSLGNWNFACRSHYWIKNNTVIWGYSWSREQIESGRALDRLAKRNYFESESPDVDEKRDVGALETITRVRCLWRKLIGWILN